MKFDKEFVYFTWVDTLENVEAFYAENIEDLKHYVEFNDMDKYGKVSFSFEKANPFKAEGDDSGRHFKFAYYDPHYKLKRAYDKNETIQFLGNDNVWHDIDFPVFDIHPSRYRVKPEDPEESKPVTNRELARWLAQGHGEYYVYDCDGWESHRCIEYQYEQDNLPVSDVMVRRWEDSEWHEPTREYMGLED